MKSKKGYFFLIDAFIGSAIIILSLVIILNSDVTTAKFQQDYTITEDYATFLINTHIQDINNEYIRNLTLSGLITNPQYSIMEQIDQFYYNARYICNAGDASCIAANLSYANKMLQNITDPLIKQKYSFSLFIKDTAKKINQSIYERNMSNISTASFVLSSRKITFLQINSSAMFGPQIVEIKVWLP